MRLSALSDESLNTDRYMFYLFYLNIQNKYWYEYILKKLINTTTFVKTTCVNLILSKQMN